MTDTDAAPDNAHVFQPAWRHFHRRLLVRMIWLAPLGVIAVIVASWPSLGTALIAIGAVLVIAGVGFAIYFSRMRVTVRDGELRIRGPFRTRRWPVHAIATLVLLPTPGTREPTLYGVAPTLERMFSLTPSAWSVDELDAIAEATGVSIARAPAGLSVDDITERYPGTIGWGTRHPWAVIALAMGGAVVAMLAVTVVTAVLLVATGQVDLPLPTPTGTTTPAP